MKNNFSLLIDKNSLKNSPKNPSRNSFIYNFIPSQKLKNSLIFILFFLFTNNIYAKSGNKLLEENLKMQKEFDKEFREIEKQFDKIFEENRKMMNEIVKINKESHESYNSLKLTENDNYLIYELIYKNIKKENIAINVSDNILTIKSNNVINGKNKIEKSKFFYSVSLPDKIKIQPEIIYSSNIKNCKKCEKVEIKFSKNEK